MSGRVIIVVRWATSALPVVESGIHCYSSLSMYSCWEDSSRYSLASDKLIIVDAKPWIYHLYWWFFVFHVFRPLCVYLCVITGIPCWLWLLSDSCWVGWAAGDRRPWGPRVGWLWPRVWFQRGNIPVSLSCILARSSWDPLKTTWKTRESFGKGSQMRNIRKKKKWL